MDGKSIAHRSACDSDRSATERTSKRPRRAQSAHPRMEDIVDMTMDSIEDHVSAKDSEPPSGSDYRNNSVLHLPEYRDLWGEAGPSSSEAGPSSSSEPICWNGHRRRSSSRANRMSADLQPDGDDDDDIIVCPPPEEVKYQQAEDDRREEDVDPFGDYSPSGAFDPLPLSNFASRHPASLPVAPYQGAARASRWALQPAPPPPRQQDGPSSSRERSAPPPLYNHLPYRLRHHRPFEPPEADLHHLGPSSSTHPAGPTRQESRRDDDSGAVHRRNSRQGAQQGSLEGLPPPALPRRQSRRVPSNEELAERIAERRRREEARVAAYNTRALEDAELRLRMEELEALEADMEGPPGPSQPPPPPAADYQHWRTSLASAAEDASRSRALEGHGRRHRWGAGSSLAEAMMGMLGEDTLLGSGEGRLHQPPSHVAGHLSAMRSAFAGMSSGRLPPHLLFSERDFNENDYEALLALDDTVENRKGASKDIIEAIPTVAVPLNGLTDTGDKRCPICLEDYVSGVTLRRLHCSHQFHKPCVDTWLGQKATCPICQGDCKTGCSA